MLSVFMDVRQRCSSLWGRLLLEVSSWSQMVSVNLEYFWEYVHLHVMRKISIWKRYDDNEFWRQVCSLIIFLTRRTRQQWKLLLRLYSITRLIWELSLIQMLTGKGLYSPCAYLACILFIFSDCMNFSQICCCGFHWPWVESKSSDCFNVCPRSWGSKFPSFGRSY